MKEKYYMTTAITYASRKPHIGNTYEIILADAIKRYKKLSNYDVFLLTGTDEHGEKVEELAKDNNKNPQDYVDEISSLIKSIWDDMDTTYDKFIRTSDKRHKEVVSKIFRKLYEQGDIYKGTYEGLYCVPCESFFTKTQAKDGLCPDCKRELKKTKEEAYFFKMSKYSDKLLKHMEENPDFIVPQSRKNEMINNFLKPGLEDLCVSRTSFSWGVPVDFDEKHVVYVWIDALSNYITAIGYDIDNPSEQFKKLWPADLHIIGKDILRFHTIYWPIILMALSLPLPKQIFGHPWLLNGEDKMSKSLGNVIYADDLKEEFGVDVVRFYLLSTMPYANDGKISYSSLITTYNSELANTLGNLIKRTCDMINKYFEGKIIKTNKVEDIDKELKKEEEKAVKKYQELMDEFKTSEAIDKVMSFARKCNKYIDETTPWLLAKDEKNKDRLQEILFNLSEGIRKITIMLIPIIPKTSQKILNQFKECESSFESLFKEYGFSEEIEIKDSQIIFKRIDKDKKLKELEEKQNKNLNKSKEDTIEIDDFNKVKLKAGQIVDCEKIKNSNKLYKLKVDDGDRIRTIVSGISNYYKEEELINKKIVFVDNLKPVKMCGEKSEGMVIAADTIDNKVKLIFLDDDVDNGTRIR